MKFNIHQYVPQAHEWPWDPSAEFYMLFESPSVNFLLWGFQGPNPLVPVPTVAHTSAMGGTFICRALVSGKPPQSVFSFLEGVKKENSSIRKNSPPPFWETY